MTITSATSRGAGNCRPRARHVRLTVVAALIVLVLQGCSSAVHDDAASVVSSLGAVPIPTAPATNPPPEAGPSHPQLLAIGEPVHVTLADGSTATVTALGPDEVLPSTGPPPEEAEGIVTVTASHSAGTLVLNAADFTSRDENGSDVALAPVGPGKIDVDAGHTASLRVSGMFASGAAQITWRYAGQVIAIWDFNIELD